MKHVLKSTLCLLLVLALALSLAACGNQQSGDTPSQPGSTGKQGEDPTATPEFAYRASFRELSDENTSDGMNPRLFTEDGFYATCYTKIGEKIPEGVTPEYEGQYDVYGTKLYYVSYEGEVKEVNYTPIEGRENEEGYLDFNSGSDISGILLNDDGTLLLCENRWANWFEGTEADRNADNYYDYYGNTNEYFLRKIDMQGQELSRTALDLDMDEYGWVNFYNCQLDAQGNLICTADQSVLVFSPEGQLLRKIEADDYISGMLALPDGRICVLSWGDRSMVLREINLERGELGSPIDIPNEAYNAQGGNKDYDLFYSNGSYLYGYKLEEGEKVKLLNWLDCDLNGDRIGSIHFRENGEIVGIYSTWSAETYKVELMTLEQVPASSLPQKQIITMATLNSYDGNLRDQIIEFNRHSDSVRIQLKDYSEFNDYENGVYDAGRTKLLTEIMAGNMPDILPLSELPYQQLAAKGLLEDLYPYIDADTELKREDYMPNILRAMEVNGKLCEVCTGFGITTLVGAASVVGDKPGWTYQQFRDALATMPEGCDPLERYVTREDILSTMVYLEMDNLVDWTTGKCSFDSQDFLDLLNFVMLFPENYDYQEGDYNGEDSPFSRIKEGRQMLMSTGLYSFDDIAYAKMYFGGETTFIGYPTNSGVGHALNLNSGYAMSSSCKDKDAAWQFLRLFLTKDQQAEQYGLPYHLGAYQEKLEKAMTPEYEKDADGNYLLDEDGNKIEISRGGFWGDDGEIHEIYAMTQEQADNLWEVVSSVDRAVDYNSSILEIVQEQAQAFFAGQKSAEEVARLIQSKANIYVNEQR